MNLQKTGVFSGVVFMGLFALGWVIIARFLPPISPSLGAEDVAAFYQKNNFTILAGLILTGFSVTFYIPWVAVVSAQMSRIEGNRPVFSWVQLSAGTLAALIIYLPIMLWLVAAFRPERNPEDILLLSDFGWLMFTTTLAPFVLQNLSIALVILSDKSTAPIFPRWLGFYNLAVTTLFLPVVLIFYFLQGPFAWNGLIGFWVPLVDFFIWMIVMSIYLFKAINTDR